MNKQLAKITKAKLSLMDRGMLSFWIFVDYEDGGQQGVGGMCLDEWDEEKRSRVGTAYGCEMIRRLLIELCVDDFSQMVNKKVWVYGSGEGLGFKPEGISSLEVDNKKSKPVIFNDVFEEFGEKS